MSSIRLLTHPFHELPELGLIGIAELQAARQGLTDHDHGSCMEIVVFDRGRNTYAAKGVEYHMTGGDFFASPPNLIHSSGGNPQDKVRLAWTQIDLALPPQRRAKATPFLGLAGGEAVRRRLAALPVVKGRALPGMYSQLTALYNLADRHHGSEKTAGGSPRPATALEPLALIDLRVRLMRFLLDFLVAAEAAQQQPHSPSTATSPGAAATQAPLIAQAIAYMQANIAVPLSVTHIARACGYSPSAFKQAFRRETGLSPADYFLRLKIDEAKIRLASGGFSVTTLAHELGFSSGQYFATVFRRLTTQTPSQYRIRHR